MFWNKKEPRKTPLYALTVGVRVAARYPQNVKPHNDDVHIGVITGITSYDYDGQTITNIGVRTGDDKLMCFSEANVLSLELPSEQNLN